LSPIRRTGVASSAAATFSRTRWRARCSPRSATGPVTARTITSAVSHPQTFSEPAAPARPLRTAGARRRRSSPMRGAADPAAAHLAGDLARARDLKVQRPELRRRVRTPHVCNRGDGPGASRPWCSTRELLDVAGRPATTSAGIDPVVLSSTGAFSKISILPTISSNSTNCSRTPRWRRARPKASWNPYRPSSGGYDRRKG